MSSRDISGRPLVVGVIATTLSMSVIVILLYNIQLGPQALPQQMVRFLLTVGLCIFLYQGANWARWVAGVLFSLGGLGGLLGGLAAISTGLAGLLLAIMGLVYAVCAIILFFAPTVRKYFGIESQAAV